MSSSLAFAAVPRGGQQVDPISQLAPLPADAAVPPRQLIRAGHGQDRTVPDDAAGLPPRLGSQLAMAAGVAGVHMAGSKRLAHLLRRHKRQRRRKHSRSLTACLATQQQSDTAPPLEKDTNPVALALRSQLAALDRTSRGSGKNRRWEDWGTARALLPEQQTPWGVVHFLGGAVLGQFPDLCYDRVLRPLADRTGLAIVCTPYETGPNHAGLATAAWNDFEQALAVGSLKYGWSFEQMPRIALGHSLGAKMQVILRCEDDSPANSEMLLGVGLMAFNNYGVEDQVRLLQEALRLVQGDNPTSGPNFFNTVLPALAKAAQRAGMEFVPSPEQLLLDVSTSYGSTRATPLRTRLFRFNDDMVDNTGEFLEAVAACPGMGAGDVASTEMEGGHLAPVFIGIGDVFGASANVAPEGTMSGKAAERMRAQFEAMSGPSFGKEADIDALVDELEGWIRSLR